MVLIFKNLGEDNFEEGTYSIYNRGTDQSGIEQGYVTKLGIAQRVCDNIDTKYLSKFVKYKSFTRGSYWTSTEASKSNAVLIDYGEGDKSITFYYSYNTKKHRTTAWPVIAF